MHATRLVINYAPYLRTQHKKDIYVHTYTIAQIHQSPYGTLTLSDVGEALGSALGRALGCGAWACVLGMWFPRELEKAALCIGRKKGYFSLTA